MATALHGADIGGTFTDVVLKVDVHPHSAKVLTTHEAPERAILDGMERVCARAGIAPSAITRIIHGTTLATNALIERRGARTALVTTQGFRDEIVRLMRLCRPATLPDGLPLSPDGLILRVS